MVRGFCVAACLVTVAASSAMARPDVVVPNAFAAAPGTSGLNTLSRDLNNPRTYQMIIDAGQLGGIPAGMLITGVTWRSWTGNVAGAWPPAGYNYADYDMFIGQAALPVGGGSTTFANNVVGGTEVQVLDGPLSITAGSFVSMGGVGAVNPWGMFIQFDTPFTYNGGSIVFTARHPGATIAGALFLDSVASGVANGVQTFTAVGNTPTVGAAATSTIFRFTWEVPAPGTLALLGLGGLVAARRRR